MNKPKSFYAELKQKHNDNRDDNENTFNMNITLSDIWTFTYLFVIPFAIVIVLCSLDG